MPASTMDAVAALVDAAAGGPDALDFAPRAAAARYSVRSHFGRACTVLLTGSTGYIGSLLLEKLLRSTDVGRVYVLVRARRGQNPADRLARVLRTPLFHLITPEQMERVTPVAGDIMQPGLGISDEDRAVLEAEVDTVLHSAADIRLDAPIHETLTANYVGALAVVRLSERMRRLRSLCYISTCYTNMNRPRGSLVEERLYPLKVGGKEVDITGLAEELLNLPADAAAQRAQSCIELWGFRNTYAFGKHLTEKALAAINAELRLPLAIVRPSLVSAISAEPYPGYCGNFAGPVGSAAAYFTGLYDDQPEAVACDPNSIWDIVPGDTAVHAILAAAAAVANPLTRAALLAAAPGGPSAGAAVDSRGASSSSGSFEDAVDPADAPEVDARAPAAAASAYDGTPLIVQIATSCTYPQTTAELFNGTVMWVSAHRRGFTLATGRLRGMDPSKPFDQAECDRLKRVAGKKVKPLAWLLRRMGGKGGKKLATQLSVGMKSFVTLNTKKYDLHVFFGVATLLRLEAALEPSERDSFSIVWRPPPTEVPRVQALLQRSGADPSTGGAAAGAGQPRGGSDSSDTTNSTNCAAEVATQPLAAAKQTAARIVELSARAEHGAAAADGAAPATDEAAASAGFSQPDALRRARGGGWPLFHNNVYAFLYKSLYNKEVPAESKIARRKLLRVMPHLGAEAADGARTVQHSFAPMRAERAR